MEPKSLDSTAAGRTEVKSCQMRILRQPVLYIPFAGMA